MRRHHRVRQGPSSIRSVDPTLCLDMEPVKIVERGGWKGGAKGAGKKMRRREGEWTAPLPLAKGCQSIRDRQKEQKGRESNWAPARFLALDLTAVSPPTLPRRTNKLPMQLSSQPPSRVIDRLSICFLFFFSIFFPCVPAFIIPFFRFQFFTFYYVFL